jgi:hypothetical protein
MFYLGLDLGQISDPSAVVILEASGEGNPRTYACRYIAQYRLGTSYPAMVRDVSDLLQREPLRDNCTLTIDYTGVGAPIFDMFCEIKDIRPIGIVITGGSSWHKEAPFRWHVSKIQLVGTVQRFLQSGRLKIGATLPHAQTLQRELRDFRVKISKASNEIYEAREGAHDDLVLALAIALFAAEHPLRRWCPVDSDEPWFPPESVRRTSLPWSWLQR